MEVLINIIVTIAIVIFVLKRMAEVARKGGDITGPPPPPPMFPEEREEQEVPEMRRREVLVRTERQGRYGMPEEEEETISDQRRPSLSQKLQERLQEAQRRIAEQRRVMDEQRQLAEEQFEASREAARRGDYREPVQAAPATASSGGGGMGERRRARGMPATVFSRSTLVQGIIMREILGPPVSLREETLR
ncbi:MAG: hypothetical protein ACYC9O_01320 [Candidatus Latescibacterota bacterium]